MKNPNDFSPRSAEAASNSARERLLSLMLSADRESRRSPQAISIRGSWQDHIPLSHAQERLWFLEQIGLVGAAYNVPLALRLTGHVVEEALQESLTDLVRRHESLRTHFGVRDGVPHQIIDPPSPVVLHSVDLSHVVDIQDREAQLHECVQRERMRRFDLSQGPLLCATLIRLAGREHVLLLTIHHIVMDGWSLGILVHELSALYAAHAQGRPSPLPDLKLQYADYAIWQRQSLEAKSLRDQLRYWKEELAAAPPQLDLPTDRPRPAVESFRGAKWYFDLPATLSAALKELARSENATLFMVALAAYQVLLSRWSGEDDFVVGSPIAGRQRREIEGLIGFFVNTLALRADVSGNPSFRELLKRVKDVTLGAYAHQDVPFEVLVKELSPERSLARQPIFQVTLALQNYPEERLDLPGLTGSWVIAEAATTHFDLELYLYERDDRVSAVFQYATDLFDGQTIQRMADQFHALLEAIIATPDCPVQQLPLLTAQERHRLLVEWNRTAAEYPRNACAHDLFAAQAQRTPQAVALVQGDRRLTYAELDQRSNQLGNYLRSLGVSAEAIVGLCLERSLEMVIGVLGILKAGGAWLPLDSSYPQQRLSYMFGNAKSSLLLTSRALAGTLGRHDTRTVLLDSDWADIARCSTESVTSGVIPGNLAYVIYTSGSTGTPKAVGMPHGPLCNHISWMIDKFAFGPSDVILQKTPLSFDASVWELFAPLLSGARLVLAEPEGHKSPEYLCRITAEAGVTVLQLVPSMLQLVAAEPGFTECRSLRHLFSGGEPLSVELSQRIFSVLDVELHNLYGPTETCIQAITHSCSRRDAQAAFGVPIGRPVRNTQAYVLDAYLQPVPIGVRGELYLGGVQVGRGYLNRPELTAERYVANPFGAPGTRLYRTGDRVRYLADGTLEFCGRIDNQVKVRGYRIELGEIESQLRNHEHVKEAAVISSESAGEQRLVAYVVVDRNFAARAATAEAADQLRTEMVGEWNVFYEETYGKQEPAAGPSFLGWNSSYTGEPIPEPQMQEWLSCTIERIQALKPKRLLEIGCGVGLLLQHLAPMCEVYVGTDFSSSVITRLKQWIDTREDLRHAEVLHRSAAELQDFQTASFDTIVLNSVVQYFPDVGYLLAVLRDAVRLLRPGGVIFIGDVRHLGLLPTFHAAVQLSKVAATVNAGQLRRRIARAISQDKELVIDPRFFYALPGQIDGISSADVQLKRGQAANELTRYRYDVVLRTEDHVEPGVAVELMDWQALGTVADLEAALRKRRWRALRLSAVPNARLERDIAAHKAIETSDPDVGASALRGELSARPVDAIEPDLFRKIGEANGYDVKVGWSASGSLGSFDVQLFDLRCGGEIPAMAPMIAEHRQPWSTYVSDPLENSFRQQLLPRLREYLETRLPNFMIPSMWMVMKQLPLTPSGKLDRRALPAPQNRPEDMSEYVAPRNALERRIADIWAQLLRVDQVGINDDFFELGGHSLLAVRLLHLIDQTLGVTLRVTDLYKSPTIRELVSCISGEKSDDDVIDLSREAILDETIAAKPGPLRAPAEGILLTGATGFVGRFLLARLLDDTRATLYCLVRESSANEAFARLRNNLAKWSLWRDEFEQRIVPIPGDLRLPRLGMDASTYGALCRSVDNIYNCATSMNHLETYKMAKAANVDSTRELLKLATSERPKLINHISTLGVFSSTSTEETRTVDEATSIDGEEHRNSRGYTASKWVGEKIFIIASERGIPCNIFRLGLVWADTEHGRFDELQREYRILKSCLLSGCGIENYEYSLPPTPVDYVARSIVSLANRHSTGLGVFHISSPGQAVEGAFERCNAVAGTSLKLMPYYDWICEMKRLHLQGRSMPIVPLIEYAFSMDEASFYEHRQLIRSTRVRVECTRTYQELERDAITPCVLNDDLVRKSVESMLARDADLRTSASTDAKASHVSGNVSRRRGS